MKLTITQIGKPKDIQTKYGMKQKSYIKCNEYPNQFVNYWLSNATAGWSVGQTIDVEKVDVTEYQGKPQYNIIMPKVMNNTETMNEVRAQNTKIDTIIFKLKAIEDHLSGKRLLENKLNVPLPEGLEYPESDDDSQIPF